MMSRQFNAEENLPTARAHMSELNGEVKRVSRKIISTLADLVEYTYVSLRCAPHMYVAKQYATTCSSIPH